MRLEKKHVCESVFRSEMSGCSSKRTLLLRNHFTLVQQLPEPSSRFYTQICYYVNVKWFEHHTCNKVNNLILGC